MCCRLFRAHPHLQSLFPQLRHLGSEDEMRCDEALAAHGSMVIVTFNTIIEKIDNVDFVISKCAGVRQTHEDVAGFSSALFWVSDAAQLCPHTRYVLIHA